jgi:hypothetical protein
MMKKCPFRTKILILEKRNVKVLFSNIIYFVKSLLISCFLFNREYVAVCILKDSDMVIWAFSIFYTLVRSGLEFVEDLLLYG